MILATYLTPGDRILIGGIVHEIESAETGANGTLIKFVGKPYPVLVGAMEEFPVAQHCDARARDTHGNLVAACTCGWASENGHYGDTAIISDFVSREYLAHLA